MNQRQVKDLPHGLYILYWKTGGYSLASVGSDASGRRWFAPTNWITVPGFDWRMVKSTALIGPEVHNLKTVRKP